MTRLLSPLSLACAVALLWTHAHPAFVAMAVTAFASMAFQKLDRNPRLHGVFLVLAGLGLDLPKVIAGVTQLLTGKPGMPGPSPTERIPPPALPVLALAAFVACFALSCTPANSPASSANDAQTKARTAVLAASDAWNLVSNTCVALAQAEKNDTIRQKCADVLAPAQGELLAAGAVVDAWLSFDGGQPAGEVACLIGDALDKVANASSIQSLAGDAGAPTLAAVGPLVDAAKGALALLGVQCSTGSP